MLPVQLRGRFRAAPIRPAAALFAAVLWLVAAEPVAAAGPYTWNNPTTGQNWNVAGNWSPSGGPPGAGDQATLSGIISGASATTIVLTAGDTVGQLTFQDVNSTSATAAYTLGSAATPALTFNNGGAANQIVVGGFTRTTQTFAAGITLGTSQPLTITNDGAAGLTTLALNGALTGSGGAALNVGGVSNTTIAGAIGSGFGALTKTGPGVLTLTNASNAYTGDTVINGGTISVTADGQLGNAAGNITVNGGALRINSANFSSARNISVGSSGGLLDTRSTSTSSFPELDGVISGAGPLTVDGGGYVVIGGSNNTFSGDLVIRNAAVHLTGGLLSNGMLANVNSITIKGGYAGGNIGILSFDNTFQGSNNRINASAPINLNGGAITILGSIAGDVNQTAGNVRVNGYGLILGSPAGATGFGSGATALTFGTLTRNDNFSTLYVGGAVGGSPGGSSVQVTFSGMQNSTGSGPQVDVIPWIGGDRGLPVSSGTPGVPTSIAETLFVYDDNGLRALDTNSSNDFVLLNPGDPLDNGAGSNVSLSGNPAVMAGDVSVKALVLNTSVTGASTITGSGILNISNGAIANARALTINGPQLDFGNVTGYLYLGNNLTIAGNSFISGTGGLVISSNTLSGNGSLILNNTANPNTFSGGLYVNGTARVVFNSSDAQLGAPGEVIALRGGTLRYSGAPSITLATAGINRPLVMDTGSGYVDVLNSAAVVTVPGLVSGVDALTKVGVGTLVLANAGNTYLGGTTVSAGTLAVNGTGALGSGAVTLGSSTTLRFDAGGTLAAGVTLLNGTATVNTNGSTVSWTGPVTGAGGALTKTGGGALILSGNNTYTGNTAVNVGKLTVNNTAGSGTGYGSVSVASGATLSGTGTVFGALSIASGATLAPGNPTGKLTVRSAVTLATGSTFSVTINGAAAGQFSQLALANGASLNLGSATFSRSLGYVPLTSDKIFLVDNQNPFGGLTGTFAGLGEGALVTFADGTTANIGYTGNMLTGATSGGNDVLLYGFQPVPEPGSLLLACSGVLAGLGVWRRRRQVRPA